MRSGISQGHHRARRGAAPTSHISTLLVVIEIGQASCPFALELLKPHQRDVGVLGPVDRLDRRQMALRSFQDTKARLLRIRCTMQV
jgi:hypothetical protein